MSNFSLAQTFYLDPSAVKNAPSVFLTSINLFFKSKPTATNNKSGINYPGVTVFICETENDVPKIESIIRESIVRIAYAGINVGFNGGISTEQYTSAVSTNFKFDQPVLVSTGKKYALLVKYDDPDYVIWYAKQGDKIFGTNTPFQGVTNFSGAFYEYKNDGTWSPRTSQDLKFGLNIASFTANTTTIEVVNKDYEFLQLNNISGTFAGGETVFSNVASYAGNSTVSDTSLVVSGVTGSGFSFSNLSINDYVVLVSGTTKIVRQISYVNSTAFQVYELPSFSNTTSKYFKTPTATVFSKDETANIIYLVDSNANTTFNFTANTKLTGELSGAYANVGSVLNLPINQFLPEIGVYLPANGYANYTYDFAYSNGSAYIVANSNFDSMKNYEQKTISGYEGLLVSRTNEVLVSPANLYGSQAKSSVVKVVFGMNSTTASGLYESPYVYSEDLDIFTSNNAINDDTTNENTLNGNALSKHISKQISFDPGKSAEDIVAYATAYKPTGTDVLVYAKIHSTQDLEAFNDKEWTLLSSTGNSNTQISSNVSSDYVELAYGLPSSPPTSYTANGVVTVSSANSIIVGSGTFFSNGSTGNSATSVSAGNLIKVYSPLFPENFFVASVLSVANTTELTIDQTFTNTSILGTGFVIDVLAPKYTAFLNNQNMNIVRYYDTNMAQYDTFDTMQYKIVLTSNNQSVAPRVADFRAIGVSA